MSGLQIFFLILTFAAPAVLWAVGARNKSERFERNAARSQAILLLLIELNDLVSKMMGTTAITRHILPMQLCDWALIATALALWFRWQTCFEVAYFWGLSGTTQALITPAIHQDIPWWYQFGFFMAHSTIVAGVLFLLLTTRLRPRLQSLARVMFWSEIYLVTALIVNAWTGENYGFLSGKPDNPSLLDLLSDVHWIYVVQINLLAVVFFSALYLPWFVWDRWRGKGAVGQTSNVQRPTSNVQSAE